MPKWRESGVCLTRDEQGLDALRLVVLAGDVERRVAVDVAHVQSGTIGSALRTQGLS